MSRLTFPLSATIQTNFSALDLISGGFLSLELLPGNLTQVTTDIGEAGIVDGVGQVAVLSSAKRYAYDVNYPGGQYLLEQCLIAIAEEARQDLLSYTSIVMRDYVFPDRADIATGYTERNVRISDIKQQAGTFADYGGTIWGQGVGFRVEEIAVRGPW